MPARHSSGRSANVPLSSERNSLPRVAAVTQAFMGSVLGGAQKIHVASGSESGGDTKLSFSIAL